MSVLNKLPTLFLLLSLWGCAEPPEVIQGVTVSYDSGSKQLSLHDELPQGTIVKISTKNAEIGVTPVPGDRLRVAFHTRNGVRDALRIMNLTRQKELAGSGH